MDRQHEVSQKGRPRDSERSVEQTPAYRPKRGNPLWSALATHVPPAVQVKLEVGAPDDEYEREADRVADQVLPMPEPPVRRPLAEQKSEELRRKPLAEPITSFLQREAEPEEEEQIGSVVQTKGESHGDQGLKPNVASTIETLRGRGEPLPASRRAYFEPRFGRDFSAVQIHTGEQAVATANAVGARAFTLGNDVAFGPGQYAPHTHAGQRLMAHELTHVVQQRGARQAKLQRQAQEPRASYQLGRRALTHPEGRLEVEVGKPWKEGSGPASTYLGMARVAGIAPNRLSEELIACGAYESLAQIRGRFLIGTRIVLEKNTIVEIVVQGKVFKAGAKAKPDFNYFLREGALLLGRLGTSAFGLSAGRKAGADPQDSYDARYWTELRHPRGVIRAKVTAYKAVRELVENIGNDVPGAGGGTTRWRFDCFEFTDLLHVYAYWRMMTVREFNRKFTPLELGFHARSKLRWSRKSPESEGPGEQPYYYEGGMRSGGLLVGAREVKIPATMSELLDKAPLGSRVAFVNLDAQRKCSANSGLPYCDFVVENAVKLGRDQYAAHPFGPGPVTGRSIVNAMAWAVLDSEGRAVTEDYIRKNIFVSKIQYPVRITSGTR